MIFLNVDALLIRQHRSSTADVFLFWSVHHVVWPWPGCLIPMLARGLGLNLGYAKNEADRSSRHHSLVSCPVKTISSSYSVFSPFYDSYSFSYSTYSSSRHLSKLFLFFLWDYIGSLFLTVPERGAGGWNLFYGTEKALWYLQWSLWVGMKESNVLNFHSQGLLMCQKSLSRLPANSGIFIALLLLQGISSATELNDTLMIQAQKSYPNKTFM